MIRLCTIGPVSVHVGDKPVPATNEKILAAILYLVAERGKPISRRAFADLFFPDTDLDTSAHAGRQLIYRLRKIGVPIDGDSATITFSAAVVWDVEALLARGIATESELDALRHGYVADFAHRQSEAFLKWLERHRDSITNRLRPLLARQLQANRANGDFRLLDSTARACLALDPLNEEATLATAECLAVAGSKAEALHVLDQYLEDVGQPSPDLRIAPRLLRERISGYVAEGDRDISPLIGRDDELKAVISAIERCANEVTSACLVWGQAGIGKTRLLDEACTIAALSGHLVARVRLDRHDAGRPFAILRDLGPALLDMPGSLGASPETLAAIRGLCGRGPSQYSRRPENAYETQAIEADIRRRVLELIGAIAEEQATVLRLEDVDRVDAASLQLILDILDDPGRVCVLLSARHPQVILQLLRQNTAVSVVRLKPLPTDACRSVIESLFAHAGIVVDDNFRANAQRISAGIPLFLHLLFKKYLATSDSNALPATLSAALTARIEEIQEPVRSVFDAIVILGAQSTEPRIEAITQLPRFLLMQALRSLEEEGLIRSSDGRTMPSHDLLASTALRQMPASVAKLLHRAAAEVLERDRTLADPLDIALHWEASGDSNQAVSILTSRADAYTKMGRPNEAVALLTRARELCLTPESAMVVDEALIAACHAGHVNEIGIAAADRMQARLGMLSPENQLMAIEMASGAGRAISPFRKQLEAIAGNRGLNGPFRGRAARILVIIAEDAADETIADQSIELIRDLSNTVVEAGTARLIKETVFGSIDSALALCSEVGLLSRDVNSGGLRTQLIGNVGIAFLRCGDIRQATAYLAEAVALAQASRIWSLCVQHASMLAGVNWLIDDLDTADAWFARSQDFAKKLAAGAGFHNILIGIQIALDKGEVQRAREILEAAEIRYPRILSDRLGFDRLAYRLQIDMATGVVPSPAEVEELLRGHLLRRHLGLQDVVADTTVQVLQRVGRYEEASRIRNEYVNQHRRDRYPISKRLKGLQGVNT